MNMLLTGLKDGAARIPRGGESGDKRGQLVLHLEGRLSILLEELRGFCLDCGIVDDELRGAGVDELTRRTQIRLEKVGNFSRLRAFRAIAFDDLVSRPVDMDGRCLSPVESFIEASRTAGRFSDRQDSDQALLAAYQHATLRVFAVAKPAVDIQSPEAQSPEAQSPEAQSPEAQSPEAQSPEAIVLVDCVSGRRFDAWGAGAALVADGQLVLARPVEIEAYGCAVFMAHWLPLDAALAEELVAFLCWLERSLESAARAALPASVEAQELAYVRGEGLRDSAPMLLSVWASVSTGG